MQARQRFLQVTRSVLAIQSAFRGWKARQLAQDVKQQHAAVVIQSHWHRYRAQQAYQRYRRAVVAAQGAWRCKLARRELRRRRAEAREAGKLLQDKQALESKLREVQNILEVVQRQRNELRQQCRVRQ